jgi:hypothetical protein
MQIIVDCAIIKVKKVDHACRLVVLSVEKTRIGEDPTCMTRSCQGYMCFWHFLRRSLIGVSGGGDPPLSSSSPRLGEVLLFPLLVGVHLVGLGEARVCGTWSIVTSRRERVG